MLPIGSVRLVRVDRIYPARAEVTLVETPSWRGQIRLQDTRGFDIDKATMDEHFMPGDVVRAKLMALGDRQSTYFSTIGAELGVVFALDPDTKEVLYPVDQSHMRNPSNGTVYKRKVAKPDQVE